MIIGKIKIAYLTIEMKPLYETFNHAKYRNFKMPEAFPNEKIGY